MREKLSDWEWRVNNLYWITDKNGKRVKFHMNEAQLALFRGMHYRNIILKARQLGFTTFVMIFMLDAALFTKNTKCAVIAHSKDDATRLFREKIKYAYDELPAAIRDNVRATNDRAGELVFSNGSSITVGTSFRGGTLKYLHISEFGKICAKYPDKAREIVTGAFEAVSKDCVIFIESTAEGKAGYFYEYSQQAERNAKREINLSRLDWKFFFFPWYKDPSYKLDNDAIPIPERLRDYANTLASKHGVHLSDEQLAWYAAKERTLGNDMKREYPSIPEEAFAQSIEGAYYQRQIEDIYEQQRLTKVPHETSALVHTFWDLGVSDETCIWFIQQIGREYRVIDYYQNSGEGLPFYKRMLDDIASEKKYMYGFHVAPHDINHREFGTGLSRIEQAASLGINFEVAPKLAVVDGIEAVRAVLPLCWFDEASTEQGFAGLQAYRKEWDDKRGVWKDRPCHDWASHPADAFRTFAVALNYLQDQMSDFHGGYFSGVRVISSGGWT
ncbi:terminase [Bowmanella sp. JS7-9]|nr:terminase [Bowmanella sp. JS7-9]